MRVAQFSGYSAFLTFGFIALAVASSADDGADCASSGDHGDVKVKARHPGYSLLQAKAALQEVTDRSKSAAVGPTEAAPPSMSQKAMAEFIAMTLFVIVGCGSACGIAKVEGSAWVLQVALTFGFAITVLAYTIGHYSGGQINCAVTFGLMLAGKETWSQGACNIVAQLLGSVTGALILKAMYPEGKDQTGSLGSNAIGKDWGNTAALVGETMMTFLLMYTVLETAVNPLSAANRAQACIAIGLAVFLAHSVLIPIDGCSINPTRSFGPALVAKMTSEESTFKDMWVFWLGPLLGASLAVGVYLYMGHMGPSTFAA